MLTIGGTVASSFCCMFYDVVFFLLLICIPFHIYHICLLVRNICDNCLRGRKNLFFGVIDFYRWTSIFTFLSAFVRECVLPLPGQIWQCLLIGQKMWLWFKMRFRTNFFRGELEFFRLDNFRFSKLIFLRSVTICHLKSLFY